MTNLAFDSWLGHLPPHWIRTRFGQDVVINEGQVDPTKEPWSSMVLVAPNHIESGTGRIISLETARDQGADSGKYRARSGQVLYSKIRPALNKVAIAPVDCLCSADMYPISGRHHAVNNRFLAYWMLARPFAAYATLMSDRVKMPKVNREEVAAAPWARPPLAEQWRIADFLDAETARIDALVKKKRQMIALLEERVQALINEVAPGAMVRGVDGRPTGIAGMKCVRLGALAVVQGGFTMDAARDSGADALTLPYLRVANVLDGSLALDDIKQVTLPRVLASRSTLRPHDVLMTEGGDPDKLGRGSVWPGDITPCLHQNAIFAVRPDSRLLPEYLALVTRTRYARVYFEITSSKSTGIAHTSSTKITSFRVPMRTLDEQHRLVRRVHEALARIDALRIPAERQVNLLAERRQALITAAVTGGITV